MSSTLLLVTSQSSIFPTVEAPVGQAPNVAITGPADPVVIPYNGAVQLTFTVTGDPQPAVTWSVSPSQYATAAPNGKVTSTSDGSQQRQIVVTLKGESVLGVATATKTITIQAAPAEPTEGADFSFLIDDGYNPNADPALGEYKREHIVLAYHGGRDRHTYEGTGLGSQASPEEIAWNALHYDWGVDAVKAEGYTPLVRSMRYCLLITVPLETYTQQPDGLDVVYYRHMEAWYANPALNTEGYQMEDAFVHTAPGVRKTMLLGGSGRYMTNWKDPGALAYHIYRMTELLDGAFNGEDPAEAAFFDEFDRAVNIYQNTVEWPGSGTAVQSQIRDDYEAFIQALIAAVQKPIGPNAASSTDAFTRRIIAAGKAAWRERYIMMPSPGIVNLWKGIDDSVADGAEILIVAPWANDNDINSMAASVPAGHYDSMHGRWRMWEYVGYLMMLNGRTVAVKSPHGFNNSGEYKGIYGAFRANIGTPTGARAVYESGTDPAGQNYDVWGREFERQDGLRTYALLRPGGGDVYDEASSVEVTLPATSSKWYAMTFHDAEFVGPLSDLRLMAGEAALLVESPDGTEPSLPNTPTVTPGQTGSSVELTFGNLTDPAGGVLSDIELTVYDRDSRIAVFETQRIGAVSSYVLPSGTVEVGRPWYNPARYICRMRAAYNRSGEEIWSRPAGSVGFVGPIADTPPDGTFTVTPTGTEDDWDVSVTDLSTDREGPLDSIDYEFWLSGKDPEADPPDETWTAEDGSQTTHVLEGLPNSTEQAPHIIRVSVRDLADQLVENEHRLILPRPATFEPEGMTPIITNVGDTLNFGHPRWIYTTGWTDPRRSAIESDPSNPTGSGRVIVKRWYAGEPTEDGAGIATLMRWQDIGLPAMWQQYFRYWVFHSENWDVGSGFSTNKMGYYGADGRSGGSPIQYFFSHHGAYQPPPWPGSWHTNWLPNNERTDLFGAQNLIYPGAWNCYEVIHTSQSAIGVPDGCIEMWINGVKNIDRDDVMFVPDGKGYSNALLSGVQFYFIRGAKGLTWRVNDYMRIGELYISGKEAP